jgi:hypothetical protein
VIERDDHGHSPIHNCRSTASLDILLDLGADINATSKLGLTPLHSAALQGFEDIVDGLIFRDSNLKRVATIGSALHCAVLAQSRRVMSLLLKADNGHGNKVNVNSVDENGDTALHLAARMLRPDLLHLLFSYKINRNIRNTKGFTAKSQLGHIESDEDEKQEHFLSLDRHFEVPELKSYENDRKETDTVETTPQAADDSENSKVTESESATEPLKEPDSIKTSKKLSSEVSEPGIYVSVDGSQIEQRTAEAVLQGLQTEGNNESELLKCFKNAEAQYIQDILKWSKWNSDTLNYNQGPGNSLFNPVYPPE